MNTLIKIFSFLLFLSTLLPQQLNWSHLGGPMGGAIGDIAINSKGHIYAGTYSAFFYYYAGLYKSTDNGETWNKIKSIPYDIEVYALFINKEDHIFAGTRGQGVIYRSTDDGETWEIKATGFTSSHCWAFGQNKDGSVLVAGEAWFGRTYRSTDNGSNWTYTAPLSAISFAVDSSNNIYCGTFDGLYKSTDSGNSWSQVDTALGNGVTYGLYFHSQNSSIYLIKHIIGSGFFGGLLYISSDNGNSWDTFDGLSDIYLDWIGVSPFDENEIYVKERYFFPAGLFDTVYRTTDGGINWEPITNFPSSSHGRSVTFNLSLIDSGTLYSSADDNLIFTYFFKSTDKGISWYNISKPPAVGKELITDPNTPNRIFIFPGYHLTEDDGYTWTVADSGLSDVSSYLSFYIDPSDKTTFYNLRKDGLYV
ncbi:MAG: hypothetical protein IIA49_14355, partial [Bacteroidetes bacterium]|nr:hypothetical protein [Bacteroidota bacterium]